MLLIWLLFSGDIQISFKDAGTNQDLQCLQDGLSVKLTCTVNPLSTIVRWSKDGSTQATCLNTANNCGSPGDVDGRYSFTSDYQTGEFYFTINTVNTTVDKGTYQCKHSTETKDKVIDACGKCHEISSIGNSP